MKKMIKNPVLLLAAAAILLLMSTVGSTQAALTYYSDNYMAEVKVANIGVTVLENDEVIDFRNYLEDGRWDRKGSDENPQHLSIVPEGEKLIPGKTYDEKIVVNMITKDGEKNFRHQLKILWPRIVENTANRRPIKIGANP